MSSPLTLLLAQLAWGGDRAVTSLGVEWARAQAVGEADLDLLASERLRWTLADGAFATRALVDARLTIDPDGPTALERARVSHLGVQLDDERWRLDLGRHPVYRGGPRLVDGAQVLARPSKGVEMGAWGGLAPDLFTTTPRVRPGGGPVFSLATSQVQLSVVGEALSAPEGLDRLGVLTLARYSAAPRLELDGRLDLQAVEEGGVGLADGSVYARFRPDEHLLLDAVYDAFSSLRYLETQDLDPLAQRFTRRAQGLGLQDAILLDTLDPTLRHLFGARARWVGTGPDLRPRAELSFRTRTDPDPANRTTRLAPQLGVSGLVGDRVDVQLDGAVIAVDAAVQGDVGVVAYVQIADPVALDGSLRLLVVPDEYDGRPGWYGDLFADVVAGDFGVIAGASIEHEPLLDFDDVALGAFVRASWWLRPPRSTSRGGGGS